MPRTRRLPGRLSGPLSRLLRPIAVIGLLAVLLALAAGPAAADSLLSGKVRTGDVVTVGSTEVISTDLYAFAREVTIDGTVHGDVVAGGGTVTVNGKVDGDVIVAGGTVNVSGSIGGSVIGGAGTIDVNGSIGGAVRVAGGRVTVGGAITRDVALGAGTATVGGAIGGDLLFGAGDATMSGTVTGNIEGSATNYTRSGTLKGTENVRIQPANAWQPSGVPAFTFTRDPVLDGLRHFVAVLLFAALWLWFAPTSLRSAAETIRRRPVVGLGAGILVLGGVSGGLIALLVAIVIVAVALAAATLGGLAVLTLAAGILAVLSAVVALVVTAAFLATAAVGLGAAQALAERGRMAPMTSRWEVLGLLAAGAAVVVILTSLPVIGPIVEAIVLLIGLGAIGMVGWGGWQHRRGVSPVAAPSGPPSIPASGWIAPGAPSAS